jgi:hypothetical protein
MKRPLTALLLLFLLFNSSSAFSQNNNTPRPKQFSNFPNIINCSEAEISRIFSSAAGQSINLSFSDNFSFSGNITSNIVKYSNLQSAIIKSPAFDNTIFSISRIVNDDNSISYTGRIINLNYADGYELKKNAGGGYKLIKIETGQVIQDCKQL